jgi:hypothetical protein
MYFDRFDIMAAYYLFGSLYHSGQFSKTYKYIGRALNCGLKVSPIFKYESLSDNGKAIYDNLVETSWVK